MTLLEWVRNKVYKLLGVQKLPGTPNDNRLTFISDDEAIRVEKIRANKVWYYGDADELLNYYTNQTAYGWLANPIYNRNNRNMFWGISSIETNIKRVHCGIPKAIIDTITNIVGKPNIKCEDRRLNKILETNDFIYKLNQNSRPMTLVEGDGCWKINFNKTLTDVPLFEYYGAEDWDPILKSSILIGLIFKSYYKDKKGQNYVLNECRRMDGDSCIIEYQLFKLDRKNNLVEVPVETIPELAGLKNWKINGIKCLFAVPSKYYFNPLYKNRGKSIFDGKIDLFDMLDEIWTQASQTNRVSTPIEYYSPDILERTKDGLPILPTKYNRQYVAKRGVTDGDGNLAQGDGILTTQPELNFDKYGALASDVLSNILIGVLSPSSLGIDIAKKDNADAQREKEKQSIFTRNTIIDRETRMITELCNMALIMQDYMDRGVIVDRDYGITITYDEFANPSFESELEVLGPAWSQGQISTTQYVRLLWGDKLSEEELAEEKQYLDEQQQKNDFDMGQLMNNEGNTNTDLPSEGPQQEEVPEAEE